MCKLKDIVRFKLMTIIPQNANSQNTVLPVDDTLQDAVRIVSIQSYTASQVTAEPDNGLALQPDAAFNAAFLNLFTKKNNVNQVQLIPLRDLNRELNAGIKQYFKLPTLNLNGSSIRLGDASGQEANKCYLLGFQYILEADLGLLDPEERRMLNL